MHAVVVVNVREMKRWGSRASLQYESSYMYACCGGRQHEKDGEVGGVAGKLAAQIAVRAYVLGWLST